MFTEKPCMAQALCGPGDYLPESLHREAWQAFPTPRAACTLLF